MSGTGLGYAIMSDAPLQKISGNELAVNTNLFTNYLQQLNLPTDNIIASTKERNLVAINLPTFIDSLAAEEKREARYLSKFVGATAIGLFDAALNYVWNEVVLNLRKKVVTYGIDLFYDAAVGGKLREAYKDEEDLDGLKDSVLLDTCRKLELISDVVYRKLDHILTMRNTVAASHPNVESIGGFELLGWLQTCVKDVLQDRLSDSAIRIRSLVDNLKQTRDVIDESTLLRFNSELRNLSVPHVNNLLITVFGIFVSEETDQILRKNVSRIGPAVWQHSEERLKYRVGTMIDGYRTNLHQDKLAQGIEFLKLVKGRMYESLPARVIALENLSDQLDEAHDGWDNYHSEPSLMREILAYVRSSIDVPKETIPKLTRVILRCRIGRGLPYREGVSPAGKPLYDEFLGMLDDDGVASCLTALFFPEINSKLSNPVCFQHLQVVLNVLRKITISDRLKQAIDYLLADVPNAWKASASKKFIELTNPFIKWQFAR
jgi:hypothetical protein